MDLALTSFEVGAALDAVVATIRPLAERKLSPWQPAWGRGRQDSPRRPGQFSRQVHRNLFSNAVKFTPEGGRVEVLARLTDGAVEVIVADTGPGIAPPDLERLFEPFLQLSDPVGGPA